MAVHLFSSGGTASGAVPVGLETWIPRNRICWGPRLRPSIWAPLSLCRHKMPPTQRSHAPGLVPERPGSERQRRAPPALGLTLPSCPAQSRGRSPEAGRVSQLPRGWASSILGTHPGVRGLRDLRGLRILESKSLR